MSVSAGFLGVTTLGSQDARKLLMGLINAKYQSAYECSERSVVVIMHYVELGECLSNNGFHALKKKDFMIFRTV